MFSAVLGIVLMAPLPASSKGLYQSPVQTYVRCHFLLTGERPSFRSQEIKKIKSGEADPIDECIKILDDAVFANDGRPKVRGKKTERLVQNMSKLHFTWFSERSDFLTQGVDQNFYDSLEPALHWTRALLHPTGRATHVVKRNRHLKGVKRNDPKLKNGFAPMAGFNRVPKSDYRQIDPNDPRKKNRPWNSVRFIQRGDLLGIVDMPELRVNGASHIPIEQGKSSANDFKSLPGVNLNNMNVYRMLGAGVIGSPSYLATSIRWTQEFRGFDGERLPRLWAKAVYKDFLCKDLPAVRRADAKNYVPASTKFPFRRNESCTECHTSIDPLGGNIRNLFRAINTRHRDRVGGRLQPRITINTKYSANQRAAGWPAQVDKNYYRRPPKGRLKFRNYKGKLITKETQDLNALGHALTSEDDYFICIAKRYYQHFMHVDVNINDPEDILPGNDTDAYHKERVIKLGLELKKTNNTRALVKSILRLDDFRVLDLGASQ